MKGLIKRQIQPAGLQGGRNLRTAVEGRKRGSCGLVPGGGIQRDSEGVQAELTAEHEMLPSQPTRRYCSMLSLAEDTERGWSPAECRSSIIEVETNANSCVLQAEPTKPIIISF